MKIYKSLIIFLILIIGVSSIACFEKESNTSEDSLMTDRVDTGPKLTTDNLVFNNKISPMETIKDLDKKVDQFKAGPGLTKADIEANKRIKSQIIRGIFDIEELCKKSLSVHWRPLTKKQRKEFVELMTRLLERKAIFSKEQVKDLSKPYKINYKKQILNNEEKTEARVLTEVVTSSQSLNIDYELLKHDDISWQVFDIIVDEASLMKNYQFQFNAIINKHGFEELVSRMEKKLKKLE